MHVSINEVGDSDSLFSVIGTPCAVTKTGTETTAASGMVTKATSLRAFPLSVPCKWLIGVGLHHGTAQIRSVQHSTNQTQTQTQTPVTHPHISRGHTPIQYSGIAERAGERALSLFRWAHTQTSKGKMCRRRRRDHPPPPPTPPLGQYDDEHLQLQRENVQAEKKRPPPPPPRYDDERLQLLTWTTAAQALQLKKKRRYRRGPEATHPCRHPDLPSL